MADWSELPSELLQQICQKLNNNALYLLHFRSVCSSWRRASVQNCHHNHLPSKLPRSKGINCVRRFSEHNISLIKPPATINQQQNLRPWLIRIGPDIHGKTQIWHPLLKRAFYLTHHIHIDFNQLLVTHLGHMFHIHDRSLYDEKVVVAATCEVGHPLAVLTYDNSDNLLKIFRCKDNSWKSIPTMPPRSLWGDICVFKGRPCVADENGRTLMIEENLSIFLLAKPVPFGGKMKFLVESECNLLLVDCYGFETSSYHDDRTIRFDVFKLDEKEKKWVKLTTLGDRVLFVDHECSFSASASNLHVANGNCIIFSRNCIFSGCYDLQSSMRIFHLDQDQVSRLSVYPDYLNLFWPPPKWILDLDNSGMLSCIRQDKLCNLYLWKY
jgi:hypothetical protein